MPWCPKCKNEYRAGIEVCADCNVPLVADLNAPENVEATTLLVQMDAYVGFVFSFGKRRRIYLCHGVQNVKMNIVQGLRCVQIVMFHLLLI